MVEPENTLRGLLTLGTYQGRILKVMNILYPFPWICHFQVSTAITKPNQTKLNQNCFSYSTGNFSGRQFQLDGLAERWHSFQLQLTLLQPHLAPHLHGSLFWLPAPVHRPLPCPHHGLHFSDMPGPNPTQPGCYTHYLGPRHPSDHNWPEAILLLDSARSIKRGQTVKFRVLKETIYEIFDLEILVFLLLPHSWVFELPFLFTNFRQTISPNFTKL